MNQHLDQFFASLYESDDYCVASAKLAFALELKRALDREKLTNAALAEKLGVSRPMVSKLLRGDANLTIETMVKVCRRVGGNLFISIVREGCSARLFELAQTEKARPAGSRVPRTVSSGAHIDNVWASASNDLHDLEDGYEAEPLAA